MSSTYSWANILDNVAPYVKSIPTSTLDSFICDQINGIIWKRFPWRWAQASLTSASGVLTLVNGTQDYAIGTTTGSGYYKLLRARITRTDVTPLMQREIATISNWLAPNANQSTDPLAVDSIAYEPLTSGLRLAQCPSVTGSATYRIDGEYWFQPLKITTSVTTIVFPDQYVEVAIEGVKWKYYSLGDDPRTNDQFLIFSAKLKEMASAEDYGGEDTRFPGEGLGVGGNVSTGTWWL